MNELDPISLEIFSNALRSITDETFVALMKSAYSTNIKERHDHSTAIMDARGRLIAQAEMSLPVHVASMEGLMRSLLAKYGNRIHPGDLFVANDPHVAGGTHLPDVNLAMPVFAGGRLLGFVANIAHHADIGGMAPGSMSGGMTEIFQEGLRIPVMRLYDRGSLDEELLELFLLNVRLPVERRGDYYAQIAACRLGARRLGEVIARYGAAVSEAGFRQILERSTLRMQTALKRIPDGTYLFQDAMDDDGAGNQDLAIAVTVTARAGEVDFDFAGTCPQTPGNVNCTLNATVAAVTYAIKALLDPDAPNTQSVIESVKVTAPEGCLINCTSPSPVANRSHTCQRIIDVVCGALADALPERSTGAPNGANTMVVFSGINPETGEGYVYLETVGGGGGARATKHGKDGVQTGITNTSNLPVEAIEQEYPLLVEEYGLVPGSGGAGRFHGGRGIRRVIRPVGHRCIFNGVGERFRLQPWGVFGGGAGQSGRFAILQPDGSETALPPKTGNRTLTPEQAAIFESPGAGGYGKE
jgi:N-methylhydantoinase B